MGLSVHGIIVVYYYRQCYRVVLHFIVLTRNDLIESQKAEDSRMDKGFTVYRTADRKVLFLVNIN